MNPTNKTSLRNRMSLLLTAALALAGAARGETLTSYTSGDLTYQVATWTTSGTTTWTVPAGVINVEYLVVGGGGGGGFAYDRTGGGGGGGALATGNFAVTAGGSISITVGAGGAGGSSTSGSRAGGTGGTSSLSTKTAAGGGGGGARGEAPTAGGGAYHGGGDPGNYGGSGYDSGTYYFSAGGGRGASYGGDGQDTKGGDGGAGTANSLRTGSGVTYRGGGGGGFQFYYNGALSSASLGVGGSGGGGSGGMASRNGIYAYPSSGTANTGGGGGGGCIHVGDLSTSASGDGADGGSGIVVVRYRPLHAAPGGITFSTPTYGASQGLSWSAVATATSGYRIEILRDSGSWTLYDTTASGVTSLTIPSSEFAAMGTRQFRVQAAATATYQDGAWMTGISRTVAKATQAALTLSPSTTHTYNTTRAYTAGGGSGTGAYSDALGSGSATRTSAWNYRADAGSGTYTIEATRAADANYNARTDSFTLTMIKASQAVASGSLGSATITFGATTTVTASGGTGTGAYEFRQNGGTGTVGFSGSGTSRTLTPSAAGTAVIEVRRLGDANYNDTAWASAGTLTINKATQAALTLTPATTHTYGTTRAYTAGGGSGTGAYSDALGSGSATRTSAWNYYAEAGTGTYTINVTRAADANYNARTDTFTLTLAKSTQAVASGSLGSATITFGATTTVTASGGTGTGAYEFRQNGGTGTIGFSGSGTSRTLTPSLAGTAVIEVRRLGDANYSDSAWASAGTLTINKATQAALTLTPATTHTYNTTRAYTAGGGSGTGAYSDALGSGSATRTSAWNYRADAGSGTYTINVTRAADANYNARTDTFTLTMIKASQAVASGTLGSATITFGATTTVTASGGTGTGAYEFRQNGGTGTVGFSGSGTSRTLTPSAAGTAVIEVRRLGDANYNDTAWASAGTLTVNKATQAALTLTPATTHTYNTTRTYTAGGGSGTGAYSDALGSGSATRTSAWNYCADAGSGTYTIQVTRAADANYNARTDTFTRTMVKAVPTLTTAPVATDVLLGDALSTSSLTGGVASTTGSFAWTNPSLIPPEGPSTASVTFTPAAPGNYENMVISVNVTVVSAISRRGAAVTTFNGKIYALGGLDAEASVFRMEAGQWYTDVSLPEPRGSLAAADFNGRLYVFGGINTNATPAVRAELWAYDGATWDLTPQDLPEAQGRREHGLAALNGVLYLFGGLNAAGQALDTVWGYDGTNWTAAASLPAPRSGFGFAVHQGSLYVVGGNDAQHAPSDAVYAFDGSTWRTELSLPEPLALLASASTGNRLFAFGGGQHVYSFDGTDWTAEINLPADRYRLNGASLDGWIYVVGGGSTPEGDAQNSVYRMHSGILPTSGSVLGGALANYTVTLSGFNLGNGAADDITSVTFGNTPATLISQSATEVVVRPGKALEGTSGYVDIRVVSATKGELVATGAFNYVPLEGEVTLTTLTPASCYWNANGEVTLTGENLSASGENDVAVWLAGVPATVLSESSTQVVVRAGTASVTGLGDVRISTSYGQLLVTNAFEYLRSPQEALVFAPTSPQSYNAQQTLSATGGSGTGAMTFEVVSGPGEISGSTLTVTAGTGTIQVRATKAQDDLYLALSATGTVAAAKATAAVTLDALLHAYNGTAASATCQTDPSDLSVSVTYDGAPAAPTNAGIYAVVATISDTNWQGTATATLEIAKAAAQVVLSDLAHTYDGAANYPSHQTDPSDLTVVLTYNGSPAAPTNAGTYAVVAMINDANWRGTAEAVLTVSGRTLTVAGAQAQDRAYDGTSDATVDFSAASLSGARIGDVVSLNASGYAASFASVQVGTHAVTVSGLLLDGAQSVNYALAAPTALNATISPCTVSVTGAVVVAKTWDGTTVAEVDFSAAALAGVLPADAGQVTLDTASATAAYTNAESGVHAVTVSGLSLGGDQADNYSLQALLLDGRIFRVNPASGPLAGGNTIAVTNGHHGTVTSILVGPTSLSAQLVDSGADWFTVQMPAGTETGAVDMVVQTAVDGDFALPAAYTYLPAGSITSVTPGTDAWVGGAEVTITGTNLTDLTDPSDLTAVSLAGVGVASIVSRSPTVIVVVAGVSEAGACSGAVRVFSKAFGETVSAGAFSYGRTAGAAPVFTPASPQAFGTTNALPVDIQSGDGAISFEVLSGPGEIVNGTHLTLTAGSGTVTLRAIQAEDGFHFARVVTNTVTATKGQASVSLYALEQVYDGTAKSPTSQTSPTGLTVEITYDGSTSAPTNAGAYVVQASIAHPDWQGSATERFVIARGAASIALQGLSQTYDGTAKSPAYQTDPADLSVALTYDGGATAPTNAGTYAILAVVDGSDWAGSATGLLTVAKATQAPLVFTPASPQAYGTTNALSATGGSGDGGVTFERLSGPGRLVVTPGDEVVPEGVSLVVDAGSGTIALRATRVGDLNYLPVAVTAEVLCTAATQTLTFDAIPGQVATNRVTLVATASSGLCVDFAVTSGPGVIENLNRLRFTGTGAVTVEASQGGDAHWSPASLSRSFTVTAAAATVSLSDLTQRYDGTPKRPTVQSTPSGLTVALTFDGSAEAPAEPGEYAVVATVTQPLYAGTVSDTLTITDTPRMSLYSGVEEVPENAAPSASFGTDYGTVATNETASVMLSITNSGTLAVSITNCLFAGSGGEWLSVSNLPAQVASGSVSNFTVLWAPQALGAYAPTLVLETDSVTPAFRINFAGTGVKPGEIGLSAARLSFRATWGGADPAGQSTVLTNKGVAAYAWTNTIRYGPGGEGWLTLTPMEGLRETEGATPITAAVELGALDAGIYLATNSLTSPTALNSPVDVVVELTITRAEQAITFVNPGTQYTTATLPLAATASSGLPVSFAVESGAAVLSDGTNLTFSAAGTVCVVASQPGNVNYGPATSVTQRFEVVRSQQAALGFVPTSPQTYGTVQTLIVSGGSGEGAISFSVLSGPGRIVNGNQLEALSGTGTIEVRAVKAWDERHDAQTATATVTCAKASQTIIFPHPKVLASDDPVLPDVLSSIALRSAQMGAISPASDDPVPAEEVPPTTGSSAQMEAVSTSGLPVQYSIEDGPGVLLGEETVVFAGAGEVVISAAQPGDLNYEAAEAVTRTVTVGLSEAALGLYDLKWTYDGTPKSASVWTSPSELNVTVTYDGSLDPPTAVGTYEVVATLDDPDYTGSSTNTFEIQQTGQAIYNFRPADGTALLAGDTVALSAESTSGLPVSFTVVAGPGELDGTGTNLSFSAAGNVWVAASQAGDDAWGAATVLTNLFRVFDVTPSQGPRAGGTVVTVSHGALGTVTNVLVGGTSVLPLEVDETGFTLAMPGAAAPGLADIIIQCEGLDAIALFGVYLYNPDGGITSITPPSGSWIGGMEVTITGTHLTDPSNPSDLTELTLAGVSVASIKSASATEIVVIAGEAATAGLGAVRVLSSAYGETVLADGFAYEREQQASLVFAPDSPQAYGSTQALIASGGSGTGAVSFEVLSGPGTITEGNQLTVTAGSGTILLRAIRAQDGRYDAASAEATVTAVKANQAILGFSPGDEAAFLVNATAHLSASASSGLAVTFTLTSGPGLISDGTNLSFTALGTVVVVAIQAGDGNWNPETQTHRFTVLNGQSIRIVSITAAGGDIVLGFSGLPGRLYDVESTESLKPTAWEKIGACTMDSRGLATHTNTPVSSTRFFRLKQRE